MVIEGAVDGLSLHGWNHEPVSKLVDALSEQPNASLGQLDPDLRNVNRPIDELGLSQTVY